MIGGPGKSLPRSLDLRGIREGLRCLALVAGVALAGLWGGGLPGILPGGTVARAERLADVFPDLRVDPGSRSYDYSPAQSASDTLLLTLRGLSGYACQVRTFYSRKRLPRYDPGRKGAFRGEADESFDLAIQYAPFSVSVHLHHPRKGARVLYRSVDGVAVVRPFGFLPLKLSLSPHSSLIASRFGHTIDHADFLSYDRRILRPACLTHACLLLGTGQIFGRGVLILNVAPDELEARPVFGRMWLLLDRKTALPVSVASEGPDGHFWERIDYRSCRLDKKNERPLPTMTR